MSPNYVWTHFSLHAARMNLMGHFLYKYFPLQNQQHLERVISCLKGYIYFSSPENFNDPFELAAPIEKPTDTEALEFLKKNNNNKILKNRLIQKKLRANIHRQWDRSAKTLATEKWLKTIGVLCTTEDHKNLLMWAHYGSNHTGVCIGFNRDEPIFSDSKPVKYTFDRPTLRFSAYKSVSNEDLQNIFGNKSKEWEYEKEWRCIKRSIKDDEKRFYGDLLKKTPEKFDEIAEVLSSNGGPGIYDLNTNSIRRIYLGCRIKPDHKERIIDITRSLNLNPKIFSLSLDQRHFDLVPNKIVI